MGKLIRPGKSDHVRVLHPGRLLLGGEKENMDGGRLPAQLFCCLPRGGIGKDDGRPVRVAFHQRPHQVPFNKCQGQNATATPAAGTAVAGSAAAVTAADGTAAYGTAADGTAADGTAVNDTGTAGIATPHTGTARVAASGTALTGRTGSVTIRNGTGDAQAAGRAGLHVIDLFFGRDLELAELYIGRAGQLGPVGVGDGAAC